MKKKLLYIAVIAICLSLITGSTIAYFTAEDSARNVITTGAVDVKVEEFTLAEGTLVPDSQQVFQVMPGDRISKVVTARSMEQEAWIRMRWEITVRDAQGQPMELSAQELEKVITLEGRSDEWIPAEDWWYYTQSVGVGRSTQPLFETVVFSAAEMGNEYQGCTAQIQVTVQAVQTANNGNEISEAAGWPAD